MNKHNISGRILKVAESEMISCKHPYVGTEHLLLSLLKNKNIIKICDKYNLSYDKYKKELLNIIGSSSSTSKYILYTPLLRLVINKARENSDKDNKELDICPRCGAPVEGNNSGVCEYCKSTLINNNYTLVMSKKKMLSQK